MTVLIIGSAGFIGSSLVEYFKSLGYDVVGADVSSILTSDYHFHKVNGTEDEWQRIFSSRPFKYCINAAGSSNVNESLSRPDQDFRLNVKDTSSVLEGIRLSGNKECRYIHISSAAVYGNPSILPVKESALCQPVSPYGWNKLMAEELCREYHALYGIPVAIARPFSVYGPGLKKQLFWDIFQKWKLDPDNIELWGTGSETRDFIHIKDLIQCFECIARKAPTQAEVYNVANGEMISVKEAASSFMSEIDPSAVIRFNGQEHTGNPLQWQAEISSIKSLGYTQSVNFRKGIGNVARWMMNES